MSDEVKAPPTLDNEVWRETMYPGALDETIVAVTSSDEGAEAHVWEDGEWLTLHKGDEAEDARAADIFAAYGEAMRARAEQAEALTAGLERDVAKLNSEGVQAGIRIRAAERERDRFKQRETDIIAATEPADGGQYRADIVSAIQRIRRERDEARSMLAPVQEAARAHREALRANERTATNDDAARLMAAGAALREAAYATLATVKAP